MKHVLGTKILGFSVLGGLLFLTTSSVYAETYNSSNGTTDISVSTEGNSDVTIKSTSNTNSTTTVEKGYNESIHVESKNGDTKSQVIINGKKVYEGNSGKVEVKSNSSTTSTNGSVTGDSESKTTVTTEDGKTTVIVEKNGKASVVENNNVKAKTNLDVSVNKENNKLLIKIGNKVHEIDLLPDQAVKLVIDNNIIDTINETSLQEAVDIDVEKDQIIYTIKGTKSTKLFGLLPVKLERVVKVAAQNKEVVSYESPFYTKIITFFSKD